MAKEIPVSKGRLVAIVDDEDYEQVSAYKWTAIPAANKGNHYAARGVGRNGERHKNQSAITPSAYFESSRSSKSRSQKWQRPLIAGEAIYGLPPIARIKQIVAKHRKTRVAIRAFFISGIGGKLRLKRMSAA